MWATAYSAGVAARGDRAGNDEEALGNDNPRRNRGRGVLENLRYGEPAWSMSMSFCAVRARD